MRQRMRTKPSQDCAGFRPLQSTHGDPKSRVKLTTMHTGLPDTEAQGHLAGRLLPKKERENFWARREARRFHKREPPGLL